MFVNTCGRSEFAMFVTEGSFSLTPAARSHARECNRAGAMAAALEPADRSGHHASAVKTLQEFGTLFDGFIDLAVSAARTGRGELPNTARMRDIGPLDNSYSRNETSTGMRWLI